MSALTDLQAQIADLRERADGLMQEAQADLDAAVEAQSLDPIPLYIEDSQKYQDAQKLYAEADALETLLKDATVLEPVTAEDNWQHVYEVGEWQPVDNWSPDTVDFDEGESFSQSRTISREITDYWLNTATDEIREDESRTEYDSENQEAIGTREQEPSPVIEPTTTIVLPPVAAEDNWQHVYEVSDWQATSDWSPDTDTVDEGESFTQSRALERSITDYWTKTTTGDTREDQSHTETQTETREAMGTRQADPVIVLPPVQAVDNWQRVYEVGDWQPASEWSPDPATVYEGQTFTQSRQVERSITDYWTNTATGETREDQSRTETQTETREAIGTLEPQAVTVLPPVDAVDNWQHVYQEGEWIAVSNWSPDPNTIEHSEPFIQTRTANRNVTDYWTNTETGDRREDNSHSESQTQSRNAIGTKEPPIIVLPPVKASDDWLHVYEEGEWSPIGEWLPDSTLIPSTEVFRQTRPISRQITDYWQNTETGDVRDVKSHTEFSTESRQSVGELVITDPVKAADDWKHVYEEGPWTPTAEWSPNPSTVAKGVGFTQTRPLTRVIADYWENTVTLERREDKSRIEVSSESRSAIGTKIEDPWQVPDPVLKEPEKLPEPKHVYSEGEWETVGDWSPDPATLEKNLRFVQTRAKRRVITDYWQMPSGSRFNENTHVEESADQRNAVGTKAKAIIPGDLFPTDPGDLHTLPAKKSSAWLWLLLAGIALHASSRKKSS